MSDKHRPQALAAGRRWSHAKGLAEAALACRRHRDRARFAVAADPVQRKAARREPGAERAADMQPPLAPIEARPAIDPRRRGTQIQTEGAEKFHAGLGDRAALIRQLDIAALAQRIGEPDPELAGQM